MTICSAPARRVRSSKLPQPKRGKTVKQALAANASEPMAAAELIHSNTLHADFQPQHVRYIKLGAKGAWAADALRDGTLPFGYKPITHDACLAWDEATIRQQLKEMGRANSSSVSSAVREIKEFYSLSRDTLWVTMAHGHLWWAFADETVFTTNDSSDGQPVRFRKTRNAWSNYSLSGTPLSINSLSSAITKTASCQTTICKFDHVDHLLQCITGKPDPIQVAAAAAQNEIIRVTRSMIDGLHWKDFETLVDLIFANGGWRRTSVLGEGQADVDLVLQQPITGETAWVQIKSIADQRVLNNYLNRFTRNGSCDRFFFICHKWRGRSLATVDEQKSVFKTDIWTGERVAEAVIAAGLFDWLRQRV